MCVFQYLVHQKYRNIRATRPFVLPICLVVTLIGTLTESRTFRLKEPIGSQIKVDARILYDENILSRNEHSERKGNELGSIDKKFEHIFKKVEGNFHNHNVMININVTKVKELKNQDIRVRFSNNSDGLDGPKTLEQLVKTQERKSGKNGIVYFFTKSLLYSQSHEDDNVPVAHFALQTRGTFCTANTSAAVVMYYEENLDDFPFRATAHIFGSTRYSHFERTDLHYMNETFARCRENVP